MKSAHFDRKRLQTFATHSHISISYLLFIDDFDVYRNMYRALKAFYLILACLDYQERRKLANIFTLLLNSYGAKIEKVVKAFYKSIQRLNSEVNLDVNEHVKIVWSFAMTFLEDMSQQVDNVGFMRYIARINCRTYYCSKEERGNLEYDIRANNRYHEDTL